MTYFCLANDTYTTPPQLCFSPQILTFGAGQNYLKVTFNNTNKQNLCKKMGRLISGLLTSIFLNFSMTFKARHQLKFLAASNQPLLKEHKNSIISKMYI